MSASTQTRVYDVQEVAELLNKHPRTIGKWAERGLLPGVLRIGGSVMFKRADIDSLLEKSAAE